MDWVVETINELLGQLEDPDDPITVELSQCGKESFENLVASARQIAKNEPACEALDELVAGSHRKMTEGILVRPWQRMYTEASVLKALASLSQAGFVDTIRTLDSAIIIAGGLGRRDLILDLIKKIQGLYLPSKRPHEEYISQTLSTPVKPVQTALRSILSFDSAPSFSAFQKQHSHNPFILRNYANNWPALSRWSSMHYLRTVAGPGRIIPVELGKDYRTLDWTQKLMPWDEFLSYLQQPSSEVIYLAQYNLFMQFPQLQDDIYPPDYVYAALDAPNYSPPVDQLITNVWFGPAGTTSPAHTDPYFNIYVQVVGHKTVWMAPPDVSRYMSTDPSLTNTSQVDVFSNDSDELHQDFHNHVVPNAISATLRPGDMLFFPAGWWHAMRAETTSFSVSMWF